MAGEFTAIIAVLCFVGSNVLFRRTEHQASPLFINLFRTAIGTLTFIIIALILNIFLQIFLIPWNLWLVLFMSFLFGQVIADTSYFKAQRELGTTIAMAVSMTFPLFTYMLSLIFLNRPFELRVIISIILVGIGIVIIGKSRLVLNNKDFNNSKAEIHSLKKKWKGFFTQNTIKAVGFGMIASIGWAIGLVIIDYATNEINRILQINGLSSIIGNVIRFPFALAILALLAFRESFFQNKIGSSPNQKKTYNTWIILIIASVIGTSIGAYVYTEAARTAGATVMSLIASASPLFSLPLTYWVNKEGITKIGFLGVVLTILGVVVILL